MKYTAIAKLHDGSVAKWTGTCSIMSEAFADLTQHTQRKHIKDLHIHWTDLQGIEEKMPLPCEQRIITETVATVDRRDTATLIAFDSNEHADTFVWDDGHVTKKLSTGRRIMFNAPPRKAQAFTESDRMMAEAVLDLDTF